MTVRTVSEQHNIAECDLFTTVGREFFNRYCLPGAYPILLTSGTNDRVRHGQCLIGKVESAIADLPMVSEQKTGGTG